MGTADLLIINGRVFRGFGPGEELPLGSAKGPRPAGAPSAVAVAGERIAWVGETGEASRAWLGPGTEVIDARGGLIMAGFDDAHMHLLSGARQLDDIDLTASRNPHEIAEAIRAGAAARPGEPWVVGRGWLYAAFLDGLPTRAVLDQLVRDRPALMTAYDGHTAWANTRALEAAGIGYGTPDPANGTILRDPATDEPNGALLEEAVFLVEACLPVPSPERDLDTLRRAIAAVHRAGITSVQEAWTLVEDLPAWRDLAARGELKLRVRLALPMKPDIDLAAWREQLTAYKAEVSPMADGRWLSSGILKGFVDGVIESRTAAMLAPYEGSESRGEPNWKEEQLTAFVMAADADGWQVELHAIGDRGVRMALDAFEHAAAVNGPRETERRHRVEHIETIDAADLPRFARLGVIASMQPLHGEPSPNQATAWAEQIGPKRAALAWAAGSISRAGGRLAFGSDWPVVPFNPLLGLQVAVNRQTPDGQPPGGWIPSEAVSLPSALAAYTLGSAYAARADGWRGTIRAGLQADLVILDRDLLAEGPSAIVGTGVVATVIGGRVVHRTG